MEVRGRGLVVLGNASNQVNVPSWLPACLKQCPVFGKKAIQSMSGKTFAGKDAEQYLEISQKKVGILPIPDLGKKLDGYFSLLKSLTGETTAEWRIRSDYSLCPGTTA